MLTHVHGAATMAARSAAASAAIDGAEAVDPSAGRAPRQPCLAALSERTSHPNAPTAVEAYAWPGCGLTTAPDAGAAHQGVVIVSSAMARRREKRGGDWERGDARGFGLEFLAIAPLTEEKRHEGFGRPQLVTSFPRTTQTARASLSVSRTPRSSTRAPPRFL